MEVPVLGRNEDGSVGRVRSVVAVVQEDEYWYVTMATSDAVVIESPERQEVVTSPVTVSGRGEGYEGHLDVSMIDRSGDVLGHTFTIAGAGPELHPFSVSLPFTTPTDSIGALLVANSTGLEVGAVDFAVVDVWFSEFDSVSVFFHDASGELVEVFRPKDGPGVLRTALNALVAGPTPSEQSEGITSWFSADTAGMVVDVTLADGVAVVDFDGRLDDTIESNVTTSAGSEALLAELDATVFQFATVTSVEYRLGGSCDAFWQWLERTCHQVTRP